MFAVKATKAVTDMITSLLPSCVEWYYFALGVLALIAASTSATWAATSWYQRWDLSKKRDQKRYTCNMAVNDLARRMKFSKVNLLL